MATPIGRILLMPRGTYDPTAVYNNLDWVRYNGASWQCKLDNTTGIAPAENSNWTLMASDGTVGGWSSLTGKPFESVGKGLTVPSSGVDQDKLMIDLGTSMKFDTNKLDVAAKQTYVGTGTSSDRPISGAGGKDARDSNVHDATLTIQKNSTTIDTFTANASSNKSVNIETDEWITTSPATTVASNGQFSFIVDTSSSDVGYVPYFVINGSSTNKNPACRILSIVDTVPASTTITYESDAGSGTVVYLRKIK